MKYKVNLVVDYSILKKDDIRDHKLKLLENNVVTEIESDYPINIDRNDTIILADEDYSITDNPMDEVLKKK